jgi:hypothetical protein
VAVFWIELEIVFDRDEVFARLHARAGQHVRACDSDHDKEAGGLEKKFYGNARSQVFTLPNRKISISPPAPIFDLSGSRWPITPR